MLEIQSVREGEREREEEGSRKCLGQWERGKEEWVSESVSLWVCESDSALASWLNYRLKSLGFKTDTLRQRGKDSPTNDDWRFWFRQTKSSVLGPTLWWRKQFKKENHFIRFALCGYFSVRCVRWPMCEKSETSTCTRALPGDIAAFYFCFIFYLYYHLFK